MVGSIGFSLGLGGPDPEHLPAQGTNKRIVFRETRNAQPTGRPTDRRLDVVRPPSAEGIELLLYRGSYYKLRRPGTTDV